MPNPTRDAFIVVFDTSSLKGEVSPRSAVFREIREYIESKGLNVSLTVPDVVFHEMNRHLRREDDKNIREFNEAVALITKTFERLKRRGLLSPLPQDWDIERINMLRATHSTESDRLARTDDYLQKSLGAGFQRAIYPQVSHEKLVARLLAEKRPFQKVPESKNKGERIDEGQGDNGYRDALIWHTVCELAGRHPETKLVFVCANTSDFCEGDNLHPHLLADLSVADRARLTFFRSIAGLREFFEGLPSQEVATVNETAIAVPAIPALSRQDMVSVAESERTQNLLFEALLDFLDEIDERESGNSFFVRSTFTQFSLLDIEETADSFGPGGAESVFEATYFGRLLVVIHHRFAGREEEDRETRGITIKARLIVDRAQMLVNNLSVESTVEAQLFDLFFSATDGTGETIIVRIIEPSNLANGSNTVRFENFDRFKNAMVAIGARSDYLHRAGTQDFINTFFVQGAPMSLLEKFGFVTRVSG